MSYASASLKMFYFGVISVAVGIGIGLVTPKTKISITRNIVVTALSIGGAATLTGAFSYYLEDSYSQDNLILTPRQQKNMQCNGCSFYHGTDGVNCAPHPYGVDDKICSDYQSRN